MPLASQFFLHPTCFPLFIHSLSTPSHIYYNLIVPIFHIHISFPDPSPSITSPPYIYIMPPSQSSSITFLSLAFITPSSLGHASQLHHTLNPTSIVFHPLLYCMSPSPLSNFLILSNIITIPPFLSTSAYDFVTFKYNMS